MSDPIDYCLFNLLFSANAGCLCHKLTLLEYAPGTLAGTGIGLGLLAPDR